MIQIKSFIGEFPKRGYLALGLFVRLLLAPFLSHPFDMRIFMAVGAAVARGMTPYGQYVLQEIFAGTPHIHLYGVFPGIGYPPIWGLICGLMYTLSSWITPNNLYAYVFSLKLPIIAAELATAVLAYKILKAKTNEKLASKAFLLFLFCPFLIAVGTVWGMFDILALFFVMLSAYRLKVNWKLSSLLVSVASVLKVFPFVLVPLYSVLLYKFKLGWRVSARFLLLTSVLAGIFTAVPMIVFNWPFSNMYNALTYPVSATSTPYDGQIAFPYGAASPFNIFTLLSNLGAGGFQPPSIAVYLWIPACIAVYLMLLGRSRTRNGSESSKKENSFALTVQWSLLLLLAMFTTRVWVSEQNLTFLLAFFALSVFLQNPKDFLKVQLLWILLFSFVMIHVPATAFLWLPYPSTLNVATSFADGPFGWTRLLPMTALTFSWLALSWYYVVRKLRWKL